MTRKLRPPAFVRNTDILANRTIREPDAPDGGVGLADRTAIPTP